MYQSLRPVFLDSFASLDQLLSYLFRGSLCVVCDRLRCMLEELDAILQLCMPLASVQDELN